MDLCESTYEGYWLAPDDVGFNNNNNVLQVAFYSGVFGGNNGQDQKL